MTPEEKGYHVYNENQRQFEAQCRSIDDIAAAMFALGWETGRRELKEKVQRVICISWEKVER